MRRKRAITRLSERVSKSKKSEKDRHTEKEERGEIEGEERQYSVTGFGWSHSSALMVLNVGSLSFVGT